MANNIVVARFTHGNKTYTRGLYQWDYGITLKFDGLELPSAYTVHFANQLMAGNAKTQVGNADGVSVPDEYLITGLPVYAWIYLHTGESDGETVYAVMIPVTQRPRPVEDAPTPVQQGVIDQTIAALNAGVEQVEGIAEAIPQTIDAALQEAKDSGEFDGPPGPKGDKGDAGATGPKGPQGERGETGATGATGAQGPAGAKGDTGTPGVSPTIAVADITGGHRVTITDADGSKVFDVMDGADGQTGQTGQTGPAGADGYSPTALVSKSGSTATIMITDKNGTTTAQVSDGQNGTNGQDGAPGVGVPSGGTTGQILKKASGTDYDTEWGNEPTVPVTDVQVNGTSILSNGVANLPVASADNFGVVKKNLTYGIDISSSGQLLLIEANDTSIKTGAANTRRAIFTGNQHKSIFYGLAKAAGDTTQSQSSNAVGTYTEDAKSAISTMLNGAVSVYGSTPSITAKAGVRYVCGEVSTLDITVPASGIIDIVFESGSTPTVLTVIPPTGMTMKWANGFDPTSIEANTAYEINIMDGIYGVVGTWS